MSNKSEHHSRAATLDEALSLALLDALEKLPAAERVTFVLRDVFGMEFSEIADTVGRTPNACRQLAVSAREDLTSAGSRIASALRAALDQPEDQS
jgi:RNA polymerase sigma-70 factor (ECF subfamily)